MATSLRRPHHVLQARLASVDGTPPPQPGYADADEAVAVAARVAAAQFTVQEASSREQQRQPPPPFTTSTLQQEANKRLGMSERWAVANPAASAICSCPALPLLNRLRASLHASACSRFAPAQLGL